MACFSHPAIVCIPAGTGRIQRAGLNMAVGSFRLPADSIGTSTVTFSGVNAGCEIRVYLPDGSEAAGIENCAANQVLSWPLYSPGADNNNVTVRIVGNAYKIKEFSYVTQPGAVTLPVQQELDKWYSNPA